MTSLLRFSVKATSSAFFLLAAVSAGIAPVSAQTAHAVRPQTLIGSGWSEPNSVAVNSNGDVFVTDFGLNAVLMEKSLGGNSYSSSPTIVAKGLTDGASGVAVDLAGNVYIADTYHNRVLRVLATDLSCTTSSNCRPVVSGLNQPYCVAVDGPGNVYICDTYNNRVLKMLASGPSNAPAYTPAPVANRLASPLYLPHFLAIDHGSNIYLSVDTGTLPYVKSGPPLKVPPTDLTCIQGHCVPVGARALNAFPQSAAIHAGNVALDAGSNLFFFYSFANVNNVNSYLAMVPPTDPTCANLADCPTIVSGLPQAKGLAVDGAGNFYITLPFAKQVIKVGPAAIDFGNLLVHATSMAMVATFVFDTSGPLGSVFVNTTAASPSTTPLGQDFFHTTFGTPPMQPGQVYECKPGTTYNPGDQCTVTMTFTPSALSTYTGTAGLKDSTGKTFASVSLTGAAMLPTAQGPLTCVTTDACGDVVSLHLPFEGLVGVVTKQTASGGVCKLGAVLPAQNTFCTPDGTPVKK